jgi:hypothetical protein
LPDVTASSDACPAFLRPPFYISIGPFLLWVLVASIVLLMRRQETATATVAASPRERVA